MSEHVTNVEVEDVLSSIRRLVDSGDAKKTIEGDSVNAALHDRLVLTPALRVDTPRKRTEPAPHRETFVLRDAVVPGDPRSQFGAETEDRPVDPLPNAASRDGSVTKANAATELSEKIAALETAIGKISGQWEPDMPGEDEYSGTKAPSIVWQDDVELDAHGKPIRSAPEAGSEKTEDLPFIPSRHHREPDDEMLDGILDEEALRNLVADIVRSELQGELGARITRNVRKLVRREIHRALAARDLG